MDGVKTICFRELLFCMHSFLDVGLLHKDKTTPYRLIMEKWPRASFVGLEGLIPGAKWLQ